MSALNGTMSPGVVKGVAFRRTSVALVISCAACSAAAAAPVVSLTSPDDLTAIPIGESVSIRVVLGGLAPAQQVDGLAVLVRWDQNLLGIPTAVSAGPIVPSPLHDPLDFDAGAGAGFAIATFFTMSTQAPHHIRADGAFLEFNVPSEAVGSGALAFEYALGSEYISGGQSTDAGVIAGPPLPFAVVPEPAGLFWDTDGAFLNGAGGDAPSGVWDGTSASFNTDPAGGAAGVMTAATSAADRVVFAAGADGIGTYTVTVIGTQAAGLIKVARGSLTLAGGTIATNKVDVASGATGSVSSVLNGGTTGSLTKTGAGTLTLTGTNTHANGTTVSAGRLNGGSAGAFGTGPVTVAAGATLGVSSVDTAGSLTQRPVIASLTNNGKVDVASGGIRITSGVNEATLRAQLIAGRNGGAWNGTTGIASSTAAASGGTRQVGYEIDGSSATVAYAASGDTDLNRRVNTDDILNILASGKLDQNVNANWQEGDFDYNGRANTDDILQMLAEGVLDAGPYSRDGGQGGSTTSGVGPFPTNAKLIYNPANGNVKVDGNGFEVSGFNLEDAVADATNVFAGSQTPVFPPGGLSTTDSDTKVSWATTNSRFTGVVDLGNIAVPGLTAAQLILQLNNLNAPLSSTDTFYTALLPVGRQNFDLIVVPEPGTLGLAALAGVGLLGRRGRRQGRAMPH